MADGAWRRCSMCKKDIAHEADYFDCSVSTCKRPRTGLTFCSLGCWEAHLPMMRHRDAWAEPCKAPTRAAAEAAAAQAAGSDAEAGEEPAAVTPPAARRVVTGTAVASPARAPAPPPEVLVVASKLKAYIRARSEMNTAEEVLDTLSARLRVLCDRAIERAREDGRRTVKARDFEPNS